MDTQLVGAQLLRAFRGRRSQVAFSRRLGYRTNVCADWEQGRRAPTAHEALRAARVAKVDVAGAFEAFHGPSASRIGDASEAGQIAGWMDALRGDLPATQVASRCGLSHHAVRRWLHGATQPRWPAFLALVEGLTGRLADLVEALVADPSAVPAMTGAIDTRRRLRQLVKEHPDAFGLMLLVDTEEFPARTRRPAPWLADRLGIDVDTVERALAALLDAGLLHRAGGRLQTRGALSVDARDLHKLQAHWMTRAHERASESRRGDLVSWNLFAVSRETKERIRSLQRDFFRRLWAEVAQDEREEVVMLFTSTLISFEER